MTKPPVKADHLSDEQQVEWIRQMKLWEAENPIDKAGRHPKPLGIVSGISLFLALTFLRQTEGFDLLPMLAVPFGYLIFFITQRRFEKWDQKRRTYSQQLIDQLGD